MKMILVAGARPNFMKIAPIVRAIKDRKHNKPVFRIVHTGQHYDNEMSQTFFNDLEIPEPDFFLKAGSGFHAVQTAKIMTAFEDVCQKEKPDVVVVVGDVNSTLACSIVAKKLLIKVAHVEAGLRSFDMTMPEEVNRKVTDALADYFFVTEKSAVENLIREGVTKKDIYFIGNVMIDNLMHQMKKLEALDTREFKTYHLKKKLDNYLFLTLHRPSNVDAKDIFAGIANALNTIADTFPIIFPVHPRTDKMIKKYKIRFSESIFVTPPLGFKESLFLWKDAKIVLTDSGGLQEETTAFGVPCFTIRNNTERPITIEKGTNLLVGNSEAGIIKAFKKFNKRGIQKRKRPELWDGKAAERIIDTLIQRIP